MFKSEVGNNILVDPQILSPDASILEIAKPDAVIGRARVDAGTCLALEDLCAGDLDEGGFIRFAILSP